MWRLPVVCVLLLAACRQTWGAGDNEANLISNQVLATNTVDHISANSAAAANETSNDEDDTASGSLPPPDAPLRFVGLWASNEANCSGRAWRFTADAVRSADGPNCSIYKVSKAPGGYDLAARCPAKKPDELDLISLRFAESAPAMLVESNAIKPTGLIYCGK